MPKAEWCPVISGVCWVLTSDIYKLMCSSSVRLVPSNFSPTSGVELHSAFRVNAWDVILWTICHLLALNFNKLLRFSHFQLPVEGVGSMLHETCSGYSNLLPCMFQPLIFLLCTDLWKPDGFKYEIKYCKYWSICTKLILVAIPFALVWMNVKITQQKCKA